MQLERLYIIGQEGLRNIQTGDGRIRRISDAEDPLSAGDAENPLLAGDPGNALQAGDPGLRLSFGGALAFPGLINSHDHLDFNLFPPLKNRVYKNYKEWGSDIHASHRAAIGAVQQIPRDLRTRWGIYKNLLNGITTVVHHGGRLTIKDDLISVCQQASSYHSISGEKGWRLRLLNPFSRRRPVAIHIGEGTDPASSAEIDELIRWNVFHRDLIGIHGIAMNERQAASFRALVWCPDSNLFLYDRTAPVDRLASHTKIVFGTDSTLSASWNIWQQLRLARAQRLTGDAELWDMCTRAPATLWNLADTGGIAEGQWADMVIARPSAQTTGWDALYGLNPENLLLVLQKGNIRLFDASLRDQLVQNSLRDQSARDSFAPDDFYRIRVGGSVKYIRGNLPALMDEIRKYHPTMQFPIAGQPATN